MRGSRLGALLFVAFVPRAVRLELARQLLDSQLLVGDQGLIVGGLGSGHGEFRFGVYRPGYLDDSLIAGGDQRCLQRFDVIWKGFATRIHAQWNHKYWRMTPKK